MMMPHESNTGKGGGEVAGAADTERNAVCVVECRMAVVDVLGEKRVVLEAFYYGERISEELYERLINNGDVMREVEWQVLLAASEEAALANIAVTSWEFTQRKHYLEGFSDFYEATVENENELEAGTEIVFTVKAEVRE